MLNWHKCGRGGGAAPLLVERNLDMNIFDKIRIKKKIKKMCKVLYQLPEGDRAECAEKIVHCLRMSEEWRMKERFLDILLERWKQYV